MLPSTHKRQGTVPTALYCVSHSLDSDKSDAAFLCTAGFSFTAGNKHYLATSLHGRMEVHKQQLAADGPAVMLSDVFSVDDEKLTGAAEIGHVVCDWKSDCLDVGLVQLLVSWTNTNQSMCVVHGGAGGRVHDSTDEGHLLRRLRASSSDHPSCVLLPRRRWSRSRYTRHDRYGQKRRRRGDRGQRISESL